MRGAWLVALALLVLALTWWCWPRSPRDEVPTVVSASGADPESARGAAPSGAVGHTDAARAAAPAAPALPAGLRATCVLRGSVRDTAGQPVAGVDVEVSPGYQLPFPDFVARATTGADGRFGFDHRVPAGTWRVAVADRVLLAPKAVAIAAAAAEQELALQVEVREPGAIAGVVVDEHGQPLAGVWVEARAQGRPRARCQSAADGAFVLHCPGRAAGRVYLRWECAATGDAGMDAGVDGAGYAWGAQGLRIEAGHGADGDRREVDLVVVGPDGAPVEDFTVRALWPPQALATSHHAGGRVRVAIGRGDPLFVYPAAADLLAAGPVSAGDDDAPRAACGVTLRRVGALAVRVQRPDGTPVAGERIELLRPWDERGVDTTTRSVALTAPAAGAALQLDVAATDAAGVARLRGPAGETGLCLRVLGRQSVPCVVDSVSVPTGAAPPRVVVVDAGACVVVQVRGGPELLRYATTAAAGPRLVVRPYSVPFDPRSLTPDSCWPLAADGTVRVTGLAAGAWDLQLLCWLETTPAHDRVELWQPLRPVTVTLTTGATAEAELDARSLAPGRVAARLTRDGAPVAHAPVCMSSDGAPRQYGWTDADGVVRLPVVAPGRIWFAVEQLDPATGDNDWLRGGGAPLPPGGVLDQDVALRRD